ncbi:class I SAM-dependent methyltransferase [Pseudomonas sp. BMS12]|uniref:class I SAM-dependent methyltransferase n=1 Tax=Pseudomonas sp. BMS12 TaxID=1796033 RepID=UPI00083B1C35|nr:class I SAM-dependent methyltransferase [Pseudomonas sp. BMS12]
MESDFKEYPKTLASDDFWGQVKRTVNGQPVSEEQIQLIVATIHQALQFQVGDRLLDLACGNGALSRYFFDCCDELYGVDYSPVLIDVAKRYFEQPPARRFDVADVGDYIVAEGDPMRFTKVLCYGSFPYFPEQTARLVLSTLNTDFRNVQRVFIGNLPDIERNTEFYTDGLDHSAELKEHNSKIGIWRSQDEFMQLAADCGWQAQIQRMPEGFYAAHYRYDVLLVRAS